MHDMNRKDWSWREHGRRYVKKQARDNGVNGVWGVVRGGWGGRGGPPGRQGVSWLIDGVSAKCTETRYCVKFLPIVAIGQQKINRERKKSSRVSSNFLADVFDGASNVPFGQLLCTASRD